MIAALLNIVGKHCGSEEGSFSRKFLTFMLKDVVNYRKNVIRNNLTFCFENAERDQIENRYYNTLSKLILESAKSYQWSKDMILSKINVSEKDIKLINDANGRVVILCSHIGNWEVIIPSLPLFIEKKVFGVFKPLSNKKLNKWLLEKRGRFGLILKPMEQIARSFYSESKSVFIFINDQSPAKGSKGRWVPFFEKDTQWYDGVLKLRRGKDCTFLFQKVIPTEEGYTLEYVKLDNNFPIEDYVKNLEQNIRINPEYWLWSHNRWKNKI